MRCSRGFPGVMALVDRPQLVRRSPPGSINSTRFAADFDGSLEVGGLAADELERRGAESIALRDVLWDVRNDRLRTAREVGELAGRGAGDGRARGLPRDPVCVLGDRPARSARPRLGRDPRLRPRPRPRSRRPRGAGRDPRAHAGPDVPVRVGACPRQRVVVRLQGGGRDRRARRQHAGAACRGRR